MNSPHCSRISHIKIVQKYAVFDRLKCKNCYDVLYFNTTAVEERRNWTAVFSYDRLPCNLLWNSGMEVWSK